MGKLDADLKNKKVALEAEDIQRHADRNDFRPAYKFVKNFRQGTKNTERKAPVFLADKNGKQAQDILQENKTLEDFIKECH